jgi:hypothetical protein
MSTLDIIYRGAILRRAATADSVAIAEYLEWRISQISNADLDLVRLYELNDTAFAKIASAGRRAILKDPLVRRYIGQLLQELHSDMTSVRVDAPILRLHLPGSQDPALKSICTHRDTWYCASGAQVNWWFALHDIPNGSGIGFFLDHFLSPVENNSHEFNLDTEAAAFKVLGLGRFRTQIVPLVDIRAVPTEFPVRKGEVLLFSANHLHTTMVGSNFSRASLDFRSVDAKHHMEGAGAMKIDAFATGCNVDSYPLASEFLCGHVAPEKNHTAPPRPYHLLSRPPRLPHLHCKR